MSKTRPKAICEDDWDSVESPELSADFIRRMRPARERHPEFVTSQDGTGSAKTDPDEPDRWQFYKDKNGEFRWRRTTHGGVIVSASCDGYASRSACGLNAERHGYKGNPKNRGADDLWEFYTDSKGETRWRRRSADNRKIVGCSTASFPSQEECKENAALSGYSKSSSP